MDTNTFIEPAHSLRSPALYEGLVRSALALRDLNSRPSACDFIETILPRFVTLTNLFVHAGRSAARFTIVSVG
jgi:hypothetical protein